MGKMKQNWLLVFILLFSIFTPFVKSQSEIEPVSLTLTIYVDGTTKVDYYVQSDPTRVRVDIELFGKNLENVIVRDEDSNPLGVTINNNTAQVDSIGALELYFSYLTDTLTYEEDSIWLVNITAPVNITILLPKNAQFLDMSDIPTEIGIIGESQYLKFNPGPQYVYYLLGLPSMINEATSSIVKSTVYLTEKESEGYILTGARELLTLAMSLSETQEYLEAKTKADDALIIAKNIVEFADIAKYALSSAEAALQEARSEERTERLDAAESYLVDAQSFYDEGHYRNAEITASQATEAASLATKPVDNNFIYLVSIGFVLLTVLIVYWKTGSSK